MRLGIIDIGYNAIRAVVYEENSIGAPEIFNTKFRNDLLSLMKQDSFDSKHQVYLSIQYILHIFSRLEVTKIKCVATAILRNHPRAPEFIKFIKEKFNLTIEVIAGDKEAYLSALGMISGISDVHGIAADLGGGSLELIEINNSKIGRLSSLNLGTKIITEQQLQDVDKLVDIIKENYGDHHYTNLYFIGGALRFISRFFIDFDKYPIKNLHNLAIPREKLNSYLHYIKTKNKISEDNNSRTLNLSAVFVTQAMLKVFKPENIIVSIFGLKEGVRYELLSKQEKNHDMVLQKAIYCTNYDINKTSFEQYYEIISPLFNKSAKLYRILKISIILQSLNKNFDQTLFPKGLQEYILNSEIPFMHRERIMIALIITVSSNFRVDNNITRLAKRILGKDDFCDSYIIGYFIKIAKDIDGFEFTEPSFSILIKNHYLEIATRDVLPKPIFDKICKQLKLIAQMRRIRSS